MLDLRSHFTNCVSSLWLMVTPPLFWILDISNRLCILSDAFLIKVLPFYNVVFARSCYRWQLLGIVLTGARDCVLPSYNVQLLCDACISKESSGGFQRSFYWIGLLGWVQQELLTSLIKYFFNNIRLL